MLDILRLQQRVDTENVEDTTTRKKYWGELIVHLSSKKATAQANNAMTCPSNHGTALPANDGAGQAYQKDGK